MADGEGSEGHRDDQGGTAEGGSPPTQPQEIKLSLPDGSPFDQAHVDGLATYAREHKLSQAQAQAILDREHKAVATHIEQSKAQVPEKYDLKLPEGSQLSPAEVERTAEFAKQQGLSQEQAQELLKRESEAVGGVIEQQEEQMTKDAEEWVKQAKADSEIGGNDEAFSKNAELAKRVIQRFGTEPLRKALDETGLGNHPELLRVFVRIGKQMGEDSFIKSDASISEGRDHASVLYGGTES